MQKKARRGRFIDPAMKHMFRLPELRQMEVDPKLAQAILTIPEVDRQSVNVIAKKLRCSNDEVKSVLLNERKWRESF